MAENRVRKIQVDTSGFEEERLGRKAYKVSPSRWVEFAFRMPQDGRLERFSFKGRRYLRQIYDSPAKRKLLVAGRQVEKSTLVGNNILAYCAINPFFRTLYVSPSHTQTKTFSRDRITEAIHNSPLLKRMTNSQMLSNILEKQLVNQSKVTLRFAFLNADRCRGIASDLISIDEFQDVLLDNIPVIEECNSHASPKYGFYIYSGTPKSLDGPLEYYWARLSTQSEWVVPCRAHGTPNAPGSWHWNILGEENIGPEGLVCDKCQKPINPDDADARWAALNPSVTAKTVFEGYRIPQIMVPWINWADILHKQRVYSRAKFNNEVLGRSYDVGVRPLTRQDIIDCCNPELSMKHYRKVKQYNVPLFMGVDWAGGGSDGGSYTLMTIGGYLPFAPDIYTYFYAHRFEGLESDPELQLEAIIKTIRFFDIMFIGVDYGGGHWPNDRLVREFGTERVKRYQWVGNVKKKIKYEPQLGVPRFLCHRTEIMSDFFNGVKRKNVFAFPRWQEFDDPYSKDFLNIFAEYNERLRQNVYKHAPGLPDDTAHSCIFGFLASFFWRKRPDVVLPTREVDREFSDGKAGEDIYDELDVI